MILNRKHFWTAIPVIVSLGVLILMAIPQFEVKQSHSKNDISDLFSIIESQDTEAFIKLLDDDEFLLYSLKQKFLSDDVKEIAKGTINSFDQRLQFFYVCNQMKLLHKTTLAHEQIDRFFADLEDIRIYANKIVENYRNNRLVYPQLALSLEEERLIAYANLFLMLNQESTISSESKRAILEERGDWYLAEKKVRSPHRVLEVSLLHSLWISQSGDQVSNYEALFLQIKGKLNNETDLVRLLNDKTDSVVMVAANLIALLGTDNASTSLRFQLTQTNNEQVLFALLDAISVYAGQRSQFESQLKKMQRMTQSSDLRQKIQQTIDRLHGHSV